MVEETFEIRSSETVQNDTNLLLRISFLRHGWRKFWKLTTWNSPEWFYFWRLHMQENVSSWPLPDHLRSFLDFFWLFLTLPDLWNNILSVLTLTDRMNPDLHPGGHRGCASRLPYEYLPRLPPPLPKFCLPYTYIIGPNLWFWYGFYALVSHGIQAAWNPRHPPKMRLIRWYLW